MMSASASVEIDEKRGQKYPARFYRLSRRVGRTFRSIAPPLSAPRGAEFFFSKLVSTLCTWDKIFMDRNWKELYLINTSQFMGKTKFKSLSG